MKSRPTAEIAAQPEAMDIWPSRQFTELWEHIPGVYFFVKDRQSRFLRANRALLDRLGIKDESEIIGTTDHDRYPPHLADRLVQSDRQVMETGQPLLHHADILYDRRGALVWFRSHKLPLRDAKGNVVGVIGVTTVHRPDDHFSLGNATVDRALRLITKPQRTPPADRISALAKQLGVSVRTLNREFQKTLAMSAQEFIQRNRTQSAATALRESTDTIADIAANFGYCDQSAFTRQFRAHLGLTPRAYRERYWQRR